MTVARQCMLVVLRYNCVMSLFLPPVPLGGCVPGPNHSARGTVPGSPPLSHDALPGSHDIRSPPPGIQGELQENFQH